MKKQWLCALCLSIIIPAAGSWASDIGIYPETIEVKCGQPFTIGIVVNGAADLMGARCRVDFDSNSLQLIKYEPGALLTADNANAPLFVNPAQTGIEICTARFASSGAPGVSGNGTIATIYFTPKKSGSTMINIGDTDLRNSQNQSSAPDNKSNARILIADIQIEPNPYETDKYSDNTIRFSGLDTETTLRIYTLSGELVERLKADDTGEAKWCVKDIASGVYFCVISDKDRRIVKKIGVIK